MGSMWTGREIWSKPWSRSRAAVAYFLAIDSGGTQAQYVLGDETRALAQTVSGTIKRLRVSAEEAAAHLDEALHELERQSGVPVRAVTQTCVGAAGNSVPVIGDWLREALGSRVGGGLLLLNDVEIALEAAFHGGPGILVLAGTGSNVVGRTNTGWMTSAGGWGPMLGDQGSGHEIGQAALRALFLAIDEGEPTTLLEAFLAHWGLPSRAHLVEFANQCSMAEYARLTRPVLAAAEAGDAVARRVLTTEGTKLAHLALLVDRRMRAREPETAGALPEARRIAFAGGVMANLPMVREAVLAAVREAIPEVAPVPGIAHGVEGALWRARREGDKARGGLRDGGTEAGLQAETM